MDIPSGPSLIHSHLHSGSGPASVNAHVENQDLTLDGQIPDHDHDRRLIADRQLITE